MQSEFGKLLICATQGCTLKYAVYSEDQFVKAHLGCNATIQQSKFNTHLNEVASYQKHTRSSLGQYQSQMKKVIQDMEKVCNQCQNIQQSQHPDKVTDVTQWNGNSISELKSAKYNGIREILIKANLELEARKNDIIRIQQMNTSNLAELLKQQQKLQQTTIQIIAPKIDVVDDNSLELLIEQYQKKQFTQSISTLVNQYIYNEDIIKKHYGTIGLRRQLSRQVNPPIESTLESGVVPTMIEFMNQDEFKRLKYEAAWVITNLASGDTHACKKIVKMGAIESLIRLLNDNDTETVIQAIWGIANLSGDSTKYRDRIIDLGGLQLIIDKIDKHPDNSKLIQEGGWCISNFCRGKPLPKFNKIKNCLPLLVKCIKSSLLSQEYYTDVLWALSYLSDGDQQRIQKFIDSGVLPTIFKFIDHPQISICVPVLRILGNIMTGNVVQTGIVVDLGVIEKYVKLLDHSKKAIRRQVCWSLSNITANIELAPRVYDNQQLMQKLMSLMENDDKDIQRQILFTFFNICQTSEPGLLFTLLNRYKMADRIFQNLNAKAENVKIALRFIKVLLLKGEANKAAGANQFLGYINEHVKQQIFTLVQSHQEDISLYAQEITAYLV